MEGPTCGRALSFMKRKCEVEGCDRDHKVKGLCQKHYKRLWRGGDPHTPSCKELSLEERFQAGLVPKDPVTGCIEWTWSRLKGYGQIRRGDKMVKTHRLAYELKHGPIPPGMEVCHRCDNPACCNDEHLYLDTHAGNMADMVGKGRSNQQKGEENGNARLTEADVVEIRRRLAAGEVQRVIAADFNVDASTVRKIKTGKTWSHLSPNHYSDNK
jgi:hypothetical protein